MHGNLSEIGWVSLGSSCQLVAGLATEAANLIKHVTLSQIQSVLSAPILQFLDA